MPKITRIHPKMSAGGGGNLHHPLRKTGLIPHPNGLILGGKWLVLALGSCDLVVMPLPQWGGIKRPQIPRIHPKMRAGGEGGNCHHPPEEKHPLLTQNGVILEEKSPVLAWGS